MEYTDKITGEKKNINILYKFSVHDDFGRDIIVFKEKDMTKLAYIHPIEESIEIINDVEKIKEACMRTLNYFFEQDKEEKDNKISPLKNVSINKRPNKIPTLKLFPLDLMIEQKMTVSSKKITKYKSIIMEEQNKINNIRTKDESGEIDQKIDKTIEEYCNGQIPNSLRQNLKQKLNTILEKQINDSKTIKSENEELLKNEQEEFEKNLDEVRKIYNNSDKIENIVQRITSVLELTQYCQKQLNKQSNISMEQEELIEKYEELERKRLSYLHELKNYSYIKENSELKKHENKKYTSLISKIEDLDIKISEIRNRENSIISHSIFSSEEICNVLSFERKLRESLDYAKNQMNMQNRIEKKLQNPTDHDKDNAMMNIIVNEEKKKDSALYRTVTKIKSSKMSKNVVNKLKNCKLVKNNLVISIQNLKMSDIKAATGKTFNFIKNSKLGTNKLSKKISGFVSRKAIKIKKFRNNINSMTNDLENANKRR